MPAPPGGDRFPSQVQMSFYMLNRSTNRGRNPSSLGTTPPPTMWKTLIPFSKIACWFEFYSASPPRKNMLETHPSMRGSSVANRVDRALSAVQKSSEYLHFNNAGTKTMISRVPPRTACQPRPRWLIYDWLVGFDPI